MSEYEYKISAPLRNLITFTGSDGKPVLVIDGDKRRVEVSEGVDVSEAAQTVLAAIEDLLWHGFAARGRDDALEDAARLCEGGYTTGSTRSTLEAIAAAIRALKRFPQPVRDD